MKPRFYKKEHSLIVHLRRATIDDGDGKEKIKLILRNAKCQTFEFFHCVFYLSYAQFARLLDLSHASVF